jgi:hypothetical protein
MEPSVPKQLPNKKDIISHPFQAQGIKLRHREVGQLSAIAYLIAKVSF